MVMYAQPSCLQRVRWPSVPTTLAVDICMRSKASLTA